MPATLFCSTDASAPVLSNSLTGSLYDILKACLIDGYGTRTAKGGWQIAYDDTINKIAFYHPVKDVHFQINDDQSYQYAQIRFFTGGMTALDTGSGEVPRPTDVLYHPLKIGKRYVSGVETDLWHLLVDDDGGFIYFWTWNTSYPTGWGICQLEDLEGNPGDWMVFGRSVSTFNSSSFPQSFWTTNAGDHYCPTGPFGSNTPTKVVHIDAEEQLTQPNPRTGRIMLWREYVRNALSPFGIYGYMPNRYKCWGNPITGMFTQHERFAAGAKNYVIMVYSGAVYFMEYNSDSG